MDKASDLENIKEKILISNLPLKETSKNLVFGKGNSNAEIMFIGEAPGEKEDEQGIPFVGSAGKELDKLLSLIGLKIEDVYIANILKYRPPENRNPNIEEIESHTPYLVEQIRVIKPKIIITLGNYSTKFVLSSFNLEKMKSIPGITSLHGKVNKLKINDLDVLVSPVFHPAAMLYNPSLRRILENDFIEIKKTLENIK